MGTHNANFTQWTYTLKPGLKWSNGTPITPMDVKYGVERLCRDRHHQRAARLVLHLRPQGPEELRGSVQER